jgi:hypothetical protein
MKRTKQMKNLTGQAFEALSDAEKQKIIDDLENHREKFRRPTRAELAQLGPVIKRVVGRPKIGRGTRAVTVTIERDLLKRADALARAAGMKRSELFTQGLQYLLARKSA